MTELSIEIWKDRLNNELINLKNLKVIEKDSIIWYEQSVEVTINIKAMGFILAPGGDFGINLKPVRAHKVLLKINRGFPSPDGIDFSWQSNIFHPNIHPVDLPNSEEPGTGDICLNILKQWSKLSDLETTVKALKKLVENPDPDDPLNYDVCLTSAEIFKRTPIDILRARFNIENQY